MMLLLRSSNFTSGCRTNFILATRLMIMMMLLCLVLAASEDQSTAFRPDVVDDSSSWILSSRAVADTDTTTRDSDSSSDSSWSHENSNSAQPPKNVDDDHHLLRKLDVKVDTCMDTASWFGTASMNLFETYYECDCQGDIGSYYAFHCRLDDYCYIDLIDNTTERCINHNVTFDFSVNETTGIINTVERGTQCVDYLTSSGQATVMGERICFVDPNVCALRMKDIHGFSTEGSADLCRNTTSCPDFLVNELGYSEERMRELCPSIAMGGTECTNFGTDVCKDAEPDDPFFYRNTRDCSNVKPCTTSTCQAFLRVHPGPERIIHVYPDCDTSSLSFPPTMTSPLPTDGAAITDTPSPTIMAPNNDLDGMAADEVNASSSSCTFYRGNSLVAVTTIVASAAWLVIRMG